MLHEEEEEEGEKTLQDCKESINIQNLEKGVYFICIKIANSTASKRFIKI